MYIASAAASRRWNWSFLGTVVRWLAGDVMHVEGGTYSARKPRGLGDPVSPEPMVVEEAEKARRSAGVAVVLTVLVVARRSGRESAEFMVGGW